jgi:hypothetical protein
LTPFEIERALALVDPAGLIGMGAPLDEYSHEAFNIHQIVGDEFTDLEFEQAYLDVMTGSFTTKFFQGFKTSEDPSILIYLRDGIDPSMRFYRGAMYRVRNRSAKPPVVFEIAQQSVKSGDVITCLGRNDKHNGNSILFFLVNGYVVKDEFVGLEEFRLRWFFEEVK